MLNYNQVNRLIESTLSLARSRTQSVAVSVCDTHGELLGFARMDNVSVQAGLLAQNKAYTAARDRQPSGNLGQWAQSTGKDISYWSDSRITGFMGGMPINDNTGRVVGGIGISGLSEEEDEALAKEVLAAL